MPSTGFNRVRSRSGKIITGTSPAIYRDKGFAGGPITTTYGAAGIECPRAFAERCRDFVPKIPKMTDGKYQLALRQPEKKDNVDYGGDFEVIRRVRTRNNPTNSTYYWAGDPNDDNPGWGEESQTGGFMSLALSQESSFNVTLPNYGEDPLGLKSYWGPVFFDRANPTKPMVNLGQFAVELLLDVPQIPLHLFSRLLSVKSAGSEYLNVAFGWLPLVSDIVKTVQVMHKLDKILLQLQRDSNRGIRRRMELDVQNQVTSSTSGGLDLSGRPTKYWPSQPEARSYVEVTTKQRVWGSGRFRYHIGDDYKPLGLTSQQLRITSGIELNPRLVYELLPWSWLIDWYTNTGSIISNAISNQEDRFVADYAYVMGSIDTTSTTSQTCAIRTSRRFNSKTSVFTDSIGTISRRLVTTDSYRARYGATPYGFGLNPQTFSPKKWAILVALGLARFSPI